MAEMSELIKRLSLTKTPRNQVAGLHGIDWLKFLDQTGQTNEFSQGIGKCLIESPYQHSIHPNINIDALYYLLKQWIDHNV